MIPYSRGLMLDNANEYGIVKTEAVFGLKRHTPDDLLKMSYNLSDPVEWLLTPIGFNKRAFDVTATPSTTDNPKEKRRRSTRKLHRTSMRTGKAKKCVVKLMNKNKRMRRKNRFKMGKKLIMPLLLGLMTAKSILVPVALKALAFISAKGFLMGFFSTILASFLSLKGMFDHSHRYQDRKDEKTQVEIIQVPTPDREEHYYEDPHYGYRRDDLIPLQLPPGQMQK